MRRRPGIYKRGNIYWITYMWHGRQYFESSHSFESRDVEALLLRRKTELASGRVAARPSETLTVDELLDSYIGQIENRATQKRYRLSQRVLAHGTQNGRAFPISDLSVPPHLRDKAGSSGCVGYDH
jgi:hypothetical protein